MQTRSMIWLGLAAMLAFFISMPPRPAQAQCNFSISNLNFGTVNLLGGSGPGSSATVNIACSNPNVLSLTYRICINLNAGSGGASGSTRRMLSGSNVLNYQLYQDAAYATPWGSTTQTTLGNPVQVDLLVLPGVTSTAQRTIYGRILPSQSTAVGGAYLSSFAGAATNITYAALAILAPCSSITQNPTQAPFTVNANVDRTCLVNAQGIDFGSHGVLRTALNAAGSLAITCSNSLPYTVSLNNGLTGTAPTQRRMTRSGASIVYGLYRDTGRTQAWGTAAGQIASGTGTGATQTLPVYGRLEAQNTPAPGTYTDTVVVTVSY